MSVQDQNAKTVRIVFGIVLLMLALSFAFVPVYNMICRVTGWGGTTQTVAANTGKVYDRQMIVQFNADTDKSLPWVFKPDQRNVTVKVGEDAIVSYMAENKSSKPVTGMAIHNVTPLKAGKYFNKTQCFCFNAQTLQPHQKVHMPVTFFIDPKIMDDEELRNLKTITLSYTFYKQDTPALEKATKKLYDNANDSNKKSE